MKAEKFIISVLLSAIFVSCSSVPVKLENADLCGFVIDENNAPVSDFIVKAKGKNCSGSCISNEQGFFVISDIELGDLKINGYKEGYSFYENCNFNFYNRNNIFCIQVNSADSILSNTRNLIKAGNFSEAQKCLSDLCTSNNDFLVKVRREYSEVVGRLDENQNEIKEF